MLELLVAMFIGLFLIGGVSAIYIVSKRGYTETENVSRVNESARFALYLLSNNLAHLGFFGGANPNPPSLLNSLAAITGDCTGTASVVDTANHFRVVKATSATPVSCIADAQSDSDVLIIKSVRPVPFSDGALDDLSDNDGTVDAPEALNANRVYLWASRLGSDGQLFRGNVQPDLTRISDGVAWEYLANIYYVRNVAGREPTLSRKALRWNGTALVVDTEDLVEGVERLRVVPGVLGGNYVTPQVKYMETADMTTSDWVSVASVQLRLLVRSADIDPGGVSRNLRYVLLEGNEAGYDYFEPGAGDRRYRTVVQETVNVRNFVYP
ncbi:PilW family protein [Hydrogenophaga atypica]|uniref:PilW family protein n=1 Tax=Hydrogenophaga atypica TaxID=249409 RepID=A0ABW2QF04_9BURK